jgi:hypothetical protein
MSSALAATEIATFNALTAGVTLAPVYQHVPDGTSAPVVIVAELDGDDLDAKVSDGSKAISLTITSEYWGSARAPLLAIMDQVETTLDGAKLSQDGFTISLKQTSAEGRQVGEKTYFGTNTFTGFAIRD